MGLPVAGEEAAAAADDDDAMERPEIVSKISFANAFDSFSASPFT